MTKTMAANDDMTSSKHDEDTRHAENTACDETHERDLDLNADFSVASTQEDTLLERLMSIAAKQEGAERDVRQAGAIQLRDDDLEMLAAAGDVLQMPADSPIHRKNSDASDGIDTV